MSRYQLFTRSARGAAEGRPFGCVDPAPAPANSPVDLIEKRLRRYSSPPALGSAIGREYLAVNLDDSDEPPALFRVEEAPQPSVRPVRIS